MKPRYALLPLEGVPFSRLPEWPRAEVRVLAGPALGARFAEYLIDLPAGASGAYEADGEIELFFFVLSGGLSLSIDGKANMLRAGGYALLPPTSSFTASAPGPASLLLLRKRHEPARGVAAFRPFAGNESEVKGAVYGGDPGALLQVLVPDEIPYDIAMNIFTFEAGHSLPVTETHVMEHGLYFLQGKGMYFLDDSWMEVEATDFIWMGPFCPQSFYATGPVASKYIYYKNVNREITL